VKGREIIAMQWKTAVITSAALVALGLGLANAKVALPGPSGLIVSSAGYQIDAAGGGTSQAYITSSDGRAWVCVATDSHQDPAKILGTACQRLQLP
jgi:hypothetical protein